MQAVPILSLAFSEMKRLKLKMCLHCYFGLEGFRTWRTESFLFCDNTGQAAGFDIPDPNFVYKSER